MKRRGAIAVFVFLPAAAFANQQAADSCAAKLPKNPAAIYSASVTQISPDSDIRAIVTNVTRGMVMNGDLSRGDAKPAAEAAGACLRLLRK